MSAWVIEVTVGGKIYYLSAGNGYVRGYDTLKEAVKDLPRHIKRGRLPLCRRRGNRFPRVMEAPTYTVGRLAFIEMRD